MEHYEKKISFLGENIQTIRKHRGMKQQELADKIGINMQSLSKIERGVNYPTFDTLEKIMDVLGVTPNELLSGEWKYIDHTEPYIMDIIKRLCDTLRQFRNNLYACLFDEYAAKYASRKGGYTRIVKIGERRGDGAMKVILELV